MKSIKCLKCSSGMKKVIFDIGYGIEVGSLHCKKCGFNVTKGTILNKALETLKEQMSKEIKVVQIGTGLGVRFPNEIVKVLKLYKGENIIIKPELDGIKLIPGRT